MIRSVYQFGSYKYRIYLFGVNENTQRKCTCFCRNNGADGGGISNIVTERQRKRLPGAHAHKFQSHNYLNKLKDTT